MLTGFSSLTRPQVRREIELIHKACLPILRSRSAALKFLADHSPPLPFRDTANSTREKKKARKQLQLK